MFWHSIGDTYTDTDIAWTPQGWIIRSTLRDPCNDKDAAIALVYIPDPEHEWEEARQACGI